MEIKKFKNGNISVRYEKDYDGEMETWLDMVSLICNQTELNVTNLSEEYCLGNAIGMAMDMETVNGVYMIASWDFEDFKQGNIIKLYRRGE